MKFKARHSIRHIIQNLMSGKFIKYVMFESVLDKKVFVKSVISNDLYSH